MVGSTEVREPGDSASPVPDQIIGERATRQKRAVLTALASFDAFRSAQDIHARLRQEGQRVGLTTVYNQLRALAALGQVDALRNEQGETLYRQCGTREHHHHLICRMCGTTVEVDAPVVERWAADIATREGFRDVEHTLEVVGTCAKCAAAGSS